MKLSTLWILAIFYHLFNSWVQQQPWFQKNKMHENIIQTGNLNIKVSRMSFTFRTFCFDRGKKKIKELWWEDGCQKYIKSDCGILKKNSCTQLHKHCSLSAWACSTRTPFLSIGNWCWCWAGARLSSELVLLWNLFRIALFFHTQRATSLHCCLIQCWTSLYCTLNFWRILCFLKNWCLNIVSLPL